MSKAQLRLVEPIDEVGQPPEPSIVRPMARPEAKTIPCGWTPESVEAWRATLDEQWVALLQGADTLKRNDPVAIGLRAQAQDLLHSAWDLQKIASWLRDPRTPDE
jgi:hypothetical protein